MSNRSRLIAVPLMIAGAAVCMAAQPAESDPALTGYRDALLAQIAKLEAALPEMTLLAEKAADRIADGGNLYAAGEEAFVIEAYWRAGGVFMLEPLKEQPLSAKDVVLAGAWRNDDKAVEAVCRKAKQAGAYVILFSPAFGDPKPPLAELCDGHVVNFAPSEAVQRVSPIYDVTALWATTAELIGALSRKGKTPVMFQSVVVPNGRDRNDKYFRKDRTRMPFHEDLTVPPQPAGSLGKAYLDAIRRQVSGLRGPVLEQLNVAAALISERLRAGGSLYVQTISHFTEYEVRRAGVPSWVRAPMPPPKPEQLAAPMKPGDIYFELGYVECRLPYIEAVRKAGGKSVVTLCHASVAPLDGPQPDMLIDSQWIYGDAAITLPGYDVPILPASGVLQTAIFWTVVGKVEQLGVK